MDNQKSFIEAMTALADIFDKEMTNPAIKLYWAALKEFSDEEVHAAMAQCLNSGKFMPKPSEIREFIVSRPADKGIEQWGKVMLFLKKEGSYGDPNRLGHETFDVIQKMGGWKSICACDYRELDFKKKHFLDLYVSNDKAVNRIGGPNVELIS